MKAEQTHRFKFIGATSLALSFAALTLSIAIQPLAPNPAHATSSALFEQGCTLMQRKNFRAAEGVFTESISNSPRDVNAIFRRGQCFYCMQDPQQAITDFDRALTLQENDQIYLWRGSANAKLGNDAKAIEDYVKAMRINPELVSAMQNRNLSPAAQAGAQPNEVANIAKNTIGMTKAGVNKDTINLGNSDNAVKDYEQAFKQVVNQAATGYFFPGTAYGGICVPSSEDSGIKIIYKPARDTSEIIKKDGHDYLINKDARKSAATHTHETDIAINNAEGWFMLARDNEQLNLNDKALEAFIRAIELQPSKPLYLLGRAFYYHKVGNDDLAAADIARAQFLDPSLPKSIFYEPIAASKLKATDAAESK
jgi:tetratricopeptide (TPR) repeat protein